MYKKLHRNLTLFCSAITWLVLLVASLSFLYMSESRMREAYYVEFERNVSTMIRNIEQQSAIDDRWIQQTSASYDAYCYIRDNGKPLFLYTLNPPTDAMRSHLDMIESVALSDHDIDVTDTQASASSVCFQLPNSRDYGAVAILPNSGTTVSLTVYHNTSDLWAQIREQRILSALIIFFGAVILLVFSWLFTGYMIRPIEQSRRRQIQFIAAASHELRSPLAVILSSIHVMRDADAADREQYADYIQSEGNRMSRLVDDMLILTKSDNEQWSLALAPVELDTLLLNEYEKYGLLAKDKQISLSIELPDNTVAPLQLDPERITQVLDVLLDNALSYTPANGHISLALTQDKKEQLISVADNGPGIPDEYKNHVFERFYRTDNARKDREHFGLGLSIAYEIVKLHHGQISVSDTPGGGATFTIRLNG